MCGSNKKQRSRITRAALRKDGGSISATDCEFLYIRSIKSGSSSHSSERGGRSSFTGSSRGGSGVNWSGVDLFLALGSSVIEGLSSLSVGGWDDARRESELLTNELDSIISEGVIRPLPAEDLIHVVSALQTFHDHHDMEIVDWLSI